jgi:hypothetical protein
LQARFCERYLINRGFEEHSSGDKKICLSFMHAILLNNSEQKLFDRLPPLIKKLHASAEKSFNFPPTRLLAINLPLKTACSLTASF